MVRTPNPHRTAAALALSAALSALAPSLASAQTCAMLPPGRPGDAAPPPAQTTAAAVDTVTRELTQGGVTVIPSQDAQRRMIGEPFAECNALECGGEVVRSLGVDFAVLVTVWAPRGTPTSVVVTLIGDGDSAAGDAPVENGDVAAAALSALTTARQRWQAARMGFLIVTTHPEGAAVEVDGRLIGQAPIRHLVAAGQRSVRITLEGHEPVEQTVNVEPTQEHPLEITLEEESDELPPVTPATHTEPHFANWLIGGALVAGGVGALISPLATLVLEGQCADSTGLDDGWCRSVYQFGPASGVLMGVGIAAIIGGAVFMIAQPITVTTVVTPDSAALQLSGTF